MTLHPSFPTQRPLSGASGCVGLLLFVTFVYLSFLSLSCPTFPFLVVFFYPFIFSHRLYLYLGISFSLSPLLFSQTSWPAVHPDTLSTAVCAKLRCSSRGRSHILRRGALSQHLCLLSSQHLWPKHDLDTTTTCFLQNHPHTLHRGNIAENVLDKYQHNTLQAQRSTRYTKKAFCAQKLYKIKHCFEGVAFTVQWTRMK